jgi:hypothetical protein
MSSIYWVAWIVLQPSVLVEALVRPNDRSSVSLSSSEAFVRPNDTPERYFDILQMLTSKPRHGLLILGSALVVDEPNLERGLADVKVCTVHTDDTDNTA